MNLSLVGVKRTKEIVGSFPNHFRVTDNFPLIPLRSVTSDKFNPTEETNKAIKWCLDYNAAFPNGVIKCAASGLVLWVYRDGAHLFENGVKSIAWGHHFISDFVEHMTKAQPMHNGPTHSIQNPEKCSILSSWMRNIFSIWDGQDATVMCLRLIEIDHPQHHVSVQVNNPAAMSFVDDTLEEKITKRIAMKCHWLKDIK